MVGTVVLVHQQGAAYEVEFTTLSGDAVAVVNRGALVVHARAVS